MERSKGLPVHLLLIPLMDTDEKNNLLLNFQHYTVYRLARKNILPFGAKKPLLTLYNATGQEDSKQNNAQVDM